MVSVQNICFSESLHRKKLLCIFMLRQKYFAKCSFSQNFYFVESVYSNIKHVHISLNVLLSLAEFGLMGYFVLKLFMIHEVFFMLVLQNEALWNLVGVLTAFFS